VNGSLDTNVVLRLIVDDVPGQGAAARRLLRRGTFHISDAAIVEAAFVLGRHYKYSRAEQAALLVALAALPSIHCNLALLSRAFDLYVDHPKLSFEDCYLLTAAEQADATPFYTFDSKLASQTPAELVG